MQAAVGTVQCHEAELPPLHHSLMFQAPQQQLAPPDVCRQADWQQIRPCERLQADEGSELLSTMLSPLGAQTLKAA